MKWFFCKVESEPGKKVAQGQKLLLSVSTDAAIWRLLSAVGQLGGGYLAARSAVLPSACNEGSWLLFLSSAQPCDLFKHLVGTFVYL